MLQDEIDGLQAQLDAKEKESHDLDAEYRSQDPYYAHGYDPYYYNATVGDLEGRLKVLTEDHTHLTEDIRLLREDLDRLNGQLRELQGQSDKIEEQIKETETHSNGLYDKNVAMTHELDDGERKAAANRYELDRRLEADRQARLSWRSVYDVYHEPVHSTTTTYYHHYAHPY